ncbi:MAG: hypothetical protein ACRC4M_00690 [Mycoplasma sp.]
MNQNKYIAVEKKKIKNIDKYYQSSNWVIFIFDEFEYNGKSYDILQRTKFKDIEDNFQYIPKNKKVLLVGTPNHVMQSYRFLKTNKIKTYITLI